MNKKKFLRIIVPICFLLFLALFFLNLKFKTINNEIKTNKIEACFENNNVCYNLEVADTQVKREKGLMNIEQLPIDEGMLFSFEKENFYTFWMKNTKISLDYIWIDSDKTIVDIQSNVAPCYKDPCTLIKSKSKFKYVIELNSGEILKNNIKIGDKVLF